VNPLRAISSMAKMLVGTLQSLRLIQRHRPQSILLTGGWANIPLALAAWLKRVPVMVYLPDIEPGRTIQFLRLFARRVAITVPDSAQYFRDGQTVVTGYPLREQMLAANREAAMTHFNLVPNRKTLLVFGGSRGARSINQALLAILPQLLQEHLQIIHITGALDHASVQQVIAGMGDTGHYHVFPYLHDAMGLAFAAADLAVCRSGASTLGELPAFGLPAILVPYPYAWRYQKTNADYLAARGAAVRMDDERMLAELLSTIQGILNNDDRLEKMRSSAVSLAQAKGADLIAEQLVELARE